jgi:hypothetical protein
MGLATRTMRSTVHVTKARAGAMTISPSRFHSAHRSSRFARRRLQSHRCSRRAQGKAAVTQARLTAARAAATGRPRYPARGRYAAGIAFPTIGSRSGAQGRAANNCITSRQAHYFHTTIKFERPSVPPKTQRICTWGAARTTHPMSFQRYGWPFNCKFYLCARSREISGAVIGGATPHEFPQKIFAVPSCSGLSVVMLGWMLSDRGAVAPMRSRH